MRRSHHHRLALVAAVFLLPVAPASADPLDPPKSTLRVWLVKRQGTTPRKLTSLITYRQVQHGWNAMIVVGFQQRGRYRDLAQGDYTHGPYGDADNPYPYAYVGPAGSPDCPADGMCSWPDAMPSEWWTRVSLPVWDQRTPTTLSFYVLSVNNEDVRISPTRGWTIKELSPRGFSLRATRGEGAAVRMPGVTTAQVLTNARLDADGTSVALGIAPSCSVGHGNIRLSGGDPMRPGGPGDRSDSCVVRGSSSGPTTWTLDGLAVGVRTTGLSLAVATLPPA